MRTTGEEEEKAKKEATEQIKIIEEQGLGDKKFFSGDMMSLVDIAFSWLAYLYEVVEEVSAVKVLDVNTFPRLHAWIQNFKEVPTIKENQPDRQKLLEHLIGRRVRLLFRIVVTSMNMWRI